MNNHADNRVRLTFCGAAGTVTGSKYLVEWKREKILVDCGLFQGKKELRLRNWEKPPFDPSAITAVVLTHAHIDHTGYLPRIMKEGFRAPIFCTPATDELVEMLLLDSAHLQEEEAVFAERHGTSKHKPPKPLYTERDVRDVLPLLRVFPRRGSTEIVPGVRVEPTCAGHILGSASLSLELGGRRVTFSGDLGRYDAPILPDPQPAVLGELLLCESTYGDRLHPGTDSAAELERAVREAEVRGGPLIIPAFALGRTQTLLYVLAQLEREGKIPVLPVFVDSPMAVDVTRLYRTYEYDYDEETVKLIAARKSPLMTRQTKFCRTARESKALNSLSGPRIIISASGMATGGRILHHLTQWLPSPEATVLFVGYQAEETRGRTIQSGASEVKIFGKQIPIRAVVESISGLSAHGDQGELLRWLKSCRGVPSQVKLVHGEEPALTVFAQRITGELGWKTSAAQQMETIEL